MTLGKPKEIETTEEKRTTGELMTALFDMKRKKAEYNKSVKMLNVTIGATEKLLLGNLRDIGLDKVSNDLGTVYISPQVVPNVVNWDAFYEYVSRTNSFHLLERRLTRTAFREMHENGEEVPGVDPVSFDEVRTRKD